MPFEGAKVFAPIMAAKQGMMDIALHGVTDQQKSVAKYVTGALTGKGSGLLQPSAQANQAATQSAQSLIGQTGQAMQIGIGGAGGFGAGGGGVGGGASNLVGAMSSLPGQGMASLASAQSMMQQGSSALGSAAALAGSGALSGSGAGVGSSSAAAGATAMTASSAPAAPSAGLAPGTSPTAPQFTPLPQIPSLPRLSDVIAKLGAMLGPAGSALSGVLGGNSGEGGDDVGSGMQQPPANQFAGQGQAADYQADS